MDTECGLIKTRTVSISHTQYAVRSTQDPESALNAMIHMQYLLPSSLHRPHAYITASVRSAGQAWSMSSYVAPPFTIWNTSRKRDIDRTRTLTKPSRNACVGDRWKVLPNQCSHPPILPDFHRAPTAPVGYFHAFASLIRLL